MARPKRQQKAAELADLEWDVEREPEKPAEKAPAEAEVADAAEVSDTDKLAKALASVQAKSTVAATMGDTAGRRARAPRRKSLLLPALAYVVVFVVVAVATAALIITLT